MLFYFVDHESCSGFFAGGGVFLDDIFFYRFVQRLVVFWQELESFLGFLACYKFFDFFL